jgi:5-methylcytosine-specific restriction endonuclease McrA
MASRRSYKLFCAKEFSDLTVDEFKEMMRKRYAIKIDEFIEYYGITVEDLSNFIKNNKGISFKSSERKYLSENKLKKTRKSHDITHIELKAMRMLRGYNTLTLSKNIVVHQSQIIKYESGSLKIPGWLVDRYISHLKISANELNRLRKYINRETEGYEQSRSIPGRVKKVVMKRDKGRCCKCGDKEGGLNYHHIKHFAQGGLHLANNIQLLCNKCHAKSHKGEKAYYMLKKMAEG